MNNEKIITRFNATDEEASSITLTHGEVACFSNRSPSKESPNEDALGVIPVDKETTVLVVADGLGGMPAGEQASQTVIECLIESLNNNSVSIREAILDGIDNANQKIMDLKTGAGTTVSIAELTGNKLRTYHAGDSLILLTTSHGNIKHQSLSHSPIGYALICGAINAESAMRHPERNLISNYVGCADMHINIGPIIELAPQDTLILSSDGLSDNLYEDEICEYIRKGPMLEGVNELISQCQENMLQPLPDRRCHPDDFTLICFRQNN
ncbi:MAG: serine/threonine-protein phosphatase [Proteobacteria bacterium]|nr:serine/threonine-protein phosphatase [Pseudomonadota bacterium]NOG59305.1 serine/threonine-protein phosphatase [Pseudomonadota bacterium]